MAIFGAKLISGEAPNGVFKAFAETQSDFESPALEAWDQASVIVCLNVDTKDKTPSAHVKRPNGSWSGATAAETEAEGAGTEVDDG